MGGREEGEGEREGEGGRKGRGKGREREGGREMKHRNGMEGEKWRKVIDEERSRGRMTHSH